MSDLSYTTDGLFTRFIPNTPQGEAVWREMAKDNGCAAVLNIHAAAVLKQLRAAGYSVRKAKAAPVSMNEINDLLNELGI